MKRGDVKNIHHIEKAIVIDFKTWGRRGYNFILARVKNIGFIRSHKGGFMESSYGRSDFENPTFWESNLASNLNGLMRFNTPMLHCSQTKV